MMRKPLLGLFFLTLLACTKNTETQNLAYLVNPFIGTGGHGHTYPGASMPFGFMQLSPDTRLEGWDGCGGYHYTDSIIYGFSHTHLSGTGISDYGDLLLMPFTGEAHFNNGAVMGVENGYGSRFSHQNESAHAGYYQVHLSDYNIDVELTAGLRSGMHAYRLSADENLSLIIDLEHRDELLDFSLKLVNSQSIAGHRVSKAWAQEQHFYFFLQCSEVIKEHRFNADSTKLILHFGMVDSLLVKTGASAVSIAGAQANLETEIPHWNFNRQKADAELAWHKELSKTKVEMVSAADDTIFYSAVYHSYLNPNLFQDVDGSYRGTDMQIHQAKDHQHYTLFSLWDTYRASHPLYTITQREKTLDFIQTFLQQYQDGGKLPMWELAGNYTGCMIGYHSVPVIVDAYAKGIRDFDHDLALEAMLATAETDELGKVIYAANGYMASNEEHESVSENLEYAYDDWCIAQFAKALGKDSIYQSYNRRAQFYQNSFDPSTGFMRAKRGQQFLAPFNPSEVNFNFTEANSWQYSFYAPHDVSGLMGLLGGPTSLERKLDALFSASENTSGRKQADITGLIGQYAHGNEPSHHMAYLYSFAGASPKTQAMSRRILTEMYQNQADGLSGNEDCGQMSSWYVLSALGFYPVNPGGTQYVIGSPLVKNAEISLENGKVLKITTQNQSAENVYIQSMTWNGTPYTKGWIEHEQIMAGGSWEIVLGPEPGPVLESPITSIEEHQITPVPYLVEENGPFKDSLRLSLHCADPKATVYYMFEPKGKSYNDAYTLYTEEIILKQEGSLSFYAQSEGKEKSPEAVRVFKKLKTDRTLSYSVPFDPQYTGGGEVALLDGELGGDDFRTGFWQGWQGTNLQLDIELGPKGEYIGLIRSSHLQDLKSWILLPREVRFYISQDGKNYTFVGSSRSSVADTSFGIIKETFSARFSIRWASHVRVEVDAYGPLPASHISAGEESWMFMDEVFID